MNNEVIRKINELVLDSIEKIYIVDVFNDNIKTYDIKNNKLNLLMDEDLTKFLDNIKTSIQKEYLSSYMNMFSIPKLEEELKNNNSDRKTYFFKTLNGLNKSVTSSLIDMNGNKLIIAFEVSFIIEEQTKDSGVKYNSLLESLSDGILKIDNAFSVNKNTDVKYIEKYVNSILYGLSNTFSDLKENLNKTARNITSLDEDTILIVDDDLVTRNMIKKIFDDEYKIVMLTNGKEAIEYFENNQNKSITDSTDNVLGIFLDLTMPVMDGFSVLEYLSKNNLLSKIPVIIISGDYERETKLRVYNYNIADMLEKPFDFEVVKHRISNFINLYKSSNSLNELISSQAEKEREIINKHIETYMYDYENNISSVKECFKALATELMEEYPDYEFNEEKINKMADACTYYDIGYLSIPRTLLKKKVNFTQEELQMLKGYPLFSSKVIDYIYDIDNNDIKTYANNIAVYYHENYDGTGFPKGLRGDEIPIEAQIASICITYVNIKDSKQDVKKYMLNNKESFFNPKLVDCFVKVLEKN